MTRFHFNVCDGTDKPDRIEMEYSDGDHAQREAMRLAGEMLIDCSRKEKIVQDWSMDVTDGSGLVLFRLDFIISGVAALTITTR